MDGFTEAVDCLGFSAAPNARYGPRDVARCIVPAAAGGKNVASVAEARRYAALRADGDAVLSGVRTRAARLIHKSGKAARGGRGRCALLHPGRRRYAPAGAGRARNGTGRARLSDIAAVLPVLPVLPVLAVLAVLPVLPVLADSRSEISRPNFWVNCRPVFADRTSDRCNSGRPVAGMRDDFGVVCVVRSVERGGFRPVAVRGAQRRAEFPPPARMPGRAAAVPASGQAPAINRSLPVLPLRPHLPSRRTARRPARRNERRLSRGFGISRLADCAVFGTINAVVGPRLYPPCRTSDAAF